MKLRNLWITLCVVFLFIGLTGNSGWTTSSMLPAAEGLSNNPVDFTFPLAVGNVWVYERTITIRLGTTLPAAPVRATMTIPFEITPGKFLVVLNGFNPFRAQPLVAEIAATPQGPIFSRSGESRLLKGMLLPSRLAVGDIINHLTGRPPNPKSLVFTVASVSETVTVPAGTFKDAIQVNFSYADNVFGASGKLFLVSGVGVVKLDTTFNGPLRGLGFSGVATAELVGYQLGAITPDTDN